MGFPQFTTSMDSRATNFHKNYESFQLILEEFHALMQEVALGGPEPIRIRHQARGKLQIGRAHV